jgi:hypothetical protein
MEWFHSQVGDRFAREFADASGLWTYSTTKWYQLARVQITAIMYTLALRQECSNTQETIGEGEHERKLVDSAAGG